MSGERPIIAMLALCTAVLVGAALYFAGSIFAPLAFALFLLAIVWPLQKKLQTFLPKALALLLTLLVTVVVIIVFASIVAWGFSVIGQWMVANAARFQTVYVGWVQWLEEHDIFIGAMIAERFDMMWLVRLFQELVARLNRFAGFGILVFIFLMMALLEADSFACPARADRSGRAGAGVRRDRMEVPSLYAGAHAAQPLDRRCRLAVRPRDWSGTGTGLGNHRVCP